MHHLPAIVAVLVLAAGVALAADVGGGDDACATSYADAVTWRDVGYYGAGEARGLAVGPRLGTGRRAGDCGGTPVEVLGIEGIGAEVAIAVRGYEGLKTYAAEGFPVSVREHPLRTALYGTRPRSSGPCGAPLTLRGPITNAPALGRRFLVRSGGRDVDIELRAGTRIPDHRRNGLPYLAEGEAVVVTGRRCVNDAAGAIWATEIRRG